MSAAPHTRAVRAAAGCKERSEQDRVHVVYHILAQGELLPSPLAAAMALGGSIAWASQPSCGVRHLGQIRTHSRSSDAGPIWESFTLSHATKSAQQQEMMTKAAQGLALPVTVGVTKAALVFQNTSS